MQESYYMVYMTTLLDIFVLQSNWLMFAVDLMEVEMEGVEMVEEVMAEVD
jgi:hypothetical protein